MEPVVEDFRIRLMEYIGSLDLSVRRFEESCGLANGQINSSKVKGPSLDVLSKILCAHPDLNLNWLVGGHGPMLTTGQKKTEGPSADRVVIANWDGLAEIIDKLIKER